MRSEAREKRSNLTSNLKEKLDPEEALIAHDVRAAIGKVSKRTKNNWRRHEGDASNLYRGGGIGLFTCRRKLS